MQELEDVLAYIEVNEIGGVVFLSGDLHRSYFLHRSGTRLSKVRRGPEYYELVSSPLANDIWSTSIKYSPTPLYDATLIEEIGETTYGMIDVDLDRPGHELTLSLKGKTGTTLFSRSIGLAVLTARAERDKLVAVMWPNGKAYFFRGDQYVRYEPDPSNEGVSQAILSQ